VFGYGLLKVGDELTNFRMGVVAEHGVDGFVYIGWIGGAALRERVREEEAWQDEEAG
jgi:hypothetical protein